MVVVSGAGDVGIITCPKKILKTAIINMPLSHKKHIIIF